MEGSGATRNATQSKDSGHRRVGAKRGNKKPKKTAEEEEVKCGGGRGGRVDVVKLFYTNAQSICNKKNILKAQINKTRPHIIAITESWTHEGMTKEELKLEGYEVVGRSDRKDTVDGQGGGVLLYSSLPNVYATQLQTNFHQILAVKISNKNNRILISI